MCKYACECQHPTCVQAPEGCFVVGWPCCRHNDPQKSAFNTGDIKRRDNDWNQAGERINGLIEAVVAKMGPSGSLDIFVRNKLERLSTGKRSNVPKAMNRWLVAEGVLSKPTADWRDPHFEAFCNDLRRYIEREIENMPFLASKIESTQDGPIGLSGKLRTRSIDLSKTSRGKPLDDQCSPSENSDSEDEEMNAIQDLLKVPKPPAWKPAPNEISILLKTEIPEFSPPSSPIPSIRSTNESFDRPNPFRQRERHRSMYNLQDLSSFTSLENLSFISIDKLKLSAVEELTEISHASHEETTPDQHNANITTETDDGTSDEDEIPADLANAFSRPARLHHHRPAPGELSRRVTFDRPRYSADTLAAIRMAGLTTQDLHHQFAAENGLTISRPPSVLSVRTSGSVCSTGSSETAWSLHRGMSARNLTGGHAVAKGVAYQSSSRTNEVMREESEESDDGEADVFLQLARKEAGPSSRKWDA